MKDNLLDKPATSELVSVSDIDFEGDLCVPVHLYSYVLTLIKR